MGEHKTNHNTTQDFTGTHVETFFRHRKSTAHQVTKKTKKAHAVVVATSETTGDFIHASHGAAARIHDLVESFPFVKLCFSLLIVVIDSWFLYKINQRINAIQNKLNDKEGTTLTTQLRLQLKVELNELMRTKKHIKKNLYFGILLTCIAILGIAYFGLSIMVAAAAIVIFMKSVYRCYELQQQKKEIQSKIALLEQKLKEATDDTERKILRKEIEVEQNNLALLKKDSEIIPRLLDCVTSLPIAILACLIVVGFGGPIVWALFALAALVLVTRLAVITWKANHPPPPLDLTIDTTQATQRREPALNPKDGPECAEANANTMMQAGRENQKKRTQTLVPGAVKPKKEGSADGISSCSSTRATLTKLTTKKPNAQPASEAKEHKESKTAIQQDTSTNINKNSIAAAICVIFLLFTFNTLSRNNDNSLVISPTSNPSCCSAKQEDETTKDSKSQERKSKSDHRRTGTKNSDANTTHSASKTVTRAAPSLPQSDTENSKHNDATVDGFTKHRLTT